MACFISGLVLIIFPSCSMTIGNGSALVGFRISLITFQNSFACWLQLMRVSVSHHHWWEFLNILMVSSCISLFMVCMLVHCLAAFSEFALHPLRFSFMSLSFSMYSFCSLSSADLFALSVLFLFLCSFDIACFAFVRAPMKRDLEI